VIRLRLQVAKQWNFVVLQIYYVCDHGKNGLRHTSKVFHVRPESIYLMQSSKPLTKKQLDGNKLQCQTPVLSFA
jgi:hypothetical protein